MKELDFLKKSRIEVVEESEKMKESYLKKSESNLESAKILLDEEKLEESMGLIYYSMYNCVIALFFKVGIKCKNHIASINLLRELFEIDNSKIEYARKERIDKQYYVDFEITKKEVEELVEIAEDFNSMINNFLAKLNNDKIDMFRNKLKEILK